MIHHTMQQENSTQPYVHGRSEKEAERLLDQAGTLTTILHHDTYYPPGSRVLEAGCGVGAQTVILGNHSPGALITSVEISPDSIRKARDTIRPLEMNTINLINGDIFDLPFKNASFDHIFVCFVLEHLRDPLAALQKLRNLLQPGGTITVIEGDHGSTFFHPDSVDAQETIRCLVRLQAEGGGDACIGRRLYPLLKNAGFSDVHVTDRMVYVDASRPDLVEGFTKKTFIAMIEGAKEEALAKGMITETNWERGIIDLNRTTESDGTFSYTFFKATGLNIIQL
ncbi:class I SAM-dependent methyltransferase [Methanocalculus sp.]|uniref:class I SAM-dependent methyltransferase n=1 Tax=Methanocalculus sp. TaxID=2004547 RepID=UPI00271CB348|nr:class I SAM-dependent methyltransferase [Methanocalculus sp.]MDO8841791.1 methyltransferase domain-containing protein [Methanocalculus sp.]